MATWSSCERSTRENGRTQGPTLRGNRHDQQCTAWQEGHLGDDITNLTCLTFERFSLA